MSEFYHPILSERPEDQLKAIKWAKEEQKRIKNDKGEKIADKIMEKRRQRSLVRIRANKVYVQRCSIVDVVRRQR